MVYKLRLLVILGLLAIFSVLVSCNDDDEPKVSPIVGTWNYDSYNLDITVDGQDLLTYLVQVMGLTQEEAIFAKAFFTASLFEETDLEGTTFTFNADGSYSVKNGGVEEDSGTYLVQNNNTKLVLTSTDGTVQEFVIETLTNNRLIVSFEESFEEDINEDETLEEVGLDFEVTMVK
ncbi:lipocalin family protein [Aquiflexum sp. LQ15W]|uniref:lipocalin family protein n=1 Tax=Cognataquiflexum nitidum TaxID=2922272 RepID=UPI001F12A96A|nr:lipocalin family protein [Cognataquiflexum nitidum]MCH6199488.1 lipocalin family protein [Cognataquiflexum nitidum]